MGELCHLITARARHLEVIAQLEAKEELEVRVTTKASTTCVHVPCERVQSAALGVGEVLWSPDLVDGVPEAKVKQSEKDVVTRETVPVKEGVQGVYVRGWGEEGEEEGQFNYPQSLTVHEEEVYVCDANSNCVQVFALDGTFRRAWGERGREEGQFRYPCGVVVHGEDVYVCDRNNNRVQVFGLDGTFRRAWGEEGAEEGQFQDPDGVAVYGEKVYVSDRYNHRVQVFK